MNYNERIKYLEEWDLANPNCDRDPCETDAEYAEWLAEIADDRKFWNSDETTNMVGKFVSNLDKLRVQGIIRSSSIELANDSKKEAEEMSRADEYIGTQVKTLREQNHMSPDEFAFRIGSKGYIVSAVESNHICRIDEIQETYEDLNDFVNEFLKSICKEFNVKRNWFDISERGCL